MSVHIRSSIYIESIYHIVMKIQKSIQVEDKLLDDLKLVKRVLDTANMNDTIRELLNARGYDKEWLEHMAFVLAQEAEVVKE